MENNFPCDRANVAKEWHAQGFSCGLWIDHAGREWSYQAHDTDELFMKISGDVELELDGKTIWPAVGKEIRISAGMPYTIRNIGGNTARWLYGHPQETTTIPHTPATSKTRSFYPDVKRKRRPEKNLPALDISTKIAPHRHS